MASLLTEPAACALLVIDEAGSANLTEIARAAGTPVSTVQRALDRLAADGVVKRESPRGRFEFARGAPRRALRELAEWRLGGERASVIIRGVSPRRERSDLRGELNKAIDEIAKSVQPERVILFGSHARGTATRDSDVDLLVLFDRPIDSREMRVAIRRLLGAMSFPKDVLVARTDEVERAPLGSIVADAARDGVVVYER
jgi:predicted nucleotidyltransferase